MPLSTAAKAALCICPPALMAGTVATVPPVKRVVHHLTAARQAPKPIRRVAAKAPAGTQQAVAPRPVDCDPGLGGAGPVTPLVTYASPIPDEPGGTGFGGGAGPVVGVVGFPGGGSGGGTVTPPVITPPVDPGPGPVPEPSAWLMMIVGVGTLGAALRRRRAGAVTRGVAHRTATGGLLWSGSAAVEAGDMAATVAMKSAVAGAAGKAMLCVCPAVIAAGSVMTVPPLRQAVHAATVVPESTGPLVPIAPIVARPPCTEAVTVPVAATAIDGFPDTVGTTPVAPPAAGPAMAIAPLPIAPPASATSSAAANG